MRKRRKGNRERQGEAGKTGLARALSKLGYCSRSQAVELIRAGKVRLNGNTTRNPETPARMDQDRIEVDGRRVGEAEKIYLLMNKPRGIVTTASDEKGRETVYKLLPQGLPWIAPVGRLDQASEGLLLFTNDTEWAARVTAPETHLDKTYHVQVATVADNSLLAALERGVRHENDFLRAKDARKLREGEKNCWIEIVLDEGKNRQIRRMLEALGIEVMRLVRVAIGPLELGSLEKGKTRRILDEEKAALDQAMANGEERARTTSSEWDR